MQSLLPLSLILSIALFAISCTDQESIEAAKNDARIPSDIPFDQFMDQTGTREFKYTSKDWRDYATNYKQVNHDYAGSPHLTTYSHTMIGGMEFATDLKTDAPLDTLLFFAEELNRLKYAFPEISYNLLSAYINRGGEHLERVHTIAELAHSKALEDKAREEKIYLQFRPEDRSRYSKFETDYGVYVPKLDSLIHAL